jgi:hypothetical protein
MKQIAQSFIVAIIIALTVSACKMERSAVAPPEKAADPAAAAAKGQTSPASAPAAESIEEILGSYVGQFGDNKITLLVTKASGATVSGRSIVGGNDRPFDGTLTLDNGTYNIEAREPGDDKDDGVFKFQIAQAKPTEVKGTWKPNDAKRPEKLYTLERKKFEYRKDVGSWPEASQRLLKAEDVENLDKGEHGCMRNEIFARHGNCFSRKEMRQKIENEDWYVPNTVDIKGYLTDIEKKNIALIKRYEKYSDDYGDEYGR